MLPGHALGNQVGDLGVSGLGLIEPGHQSVIPFLVFRLIESNMSIFVDAFLDELGSNVYFCFKLGKLTLKGCGVEAIHQNLLVYGYELFFLVNHFIGCQEEQFFYFILGKRWCGAFLIFKLVIALPDDLSIGIVAVPDLRSVPATTIGALDFAGENADRTQAVLTLLAGSHQSLDHLEGFRGYDSFVVVAHIVLRYLALIHFLFLGEEVNGVTLLQERITFVFLVGEYATNVAGVPVVFATR